MADKVSYVTCPGCQGQYYLERASYAGNPDGPCECPFCKRHFRASEGHPRPPLAAADSAA